MESFFSTLKTERTNRNQYSTRDAARADIFDYIERFYNPRRRHSTLGYLSPVNYEKLTVVRLKVVSTEPVAGQTDVEIIEWSYCYRHPVPGT